MRMIFDSHLDLAWMALQYNRDITQPLDTIRQREADEQRHLDEVPTVSLPAMRQGQVRFCVGTVFVRCRRPQDSGQSQLRNPDEDYATPNQAFGAGQGQMAYYHQLERTGHIRVIRTADDLLDAARATDDDRISCLLMLEGCDPVATPEQMGLWHRQGVRIASLVHHGRNDYAVGDHDEGPLTDAGKRILREMQELNMILDISHLSDASMTEALDRFDGRVVATHSNCRHFVPGNRQLDDAQIHRIAKRDGVVGVVGFNSFLDANWQYKQPDQPPVPLARMVEHIDHICQLTGSCQHVAIGSDLDGGFGQGDMPEGLDSIADLQKLDALLAERGYHEAEITSIFHGNWIRVYHEALPAGQRT